MAATSAEPLEDAAVPLRIALGEVVVHRHEVPRRGFSGARSGRARGSRRTSCPRRSSSRRRRPRGGRSRPSSGREHPLVGLPQACFATAANASKSRSSSGSRSRAAAGTRPSCAAARRRRVVGVGLDRGDVGGLFGQPLHPAAFADAEDLLEAADRRGHSGQGTMGLPETCTGRAAGLAPLAARGSARTQRGARAARPRPPSRSSQRRAAGTTCASHERARRTDSNAVARSTPQARSPSTSQGARAACRPSSSRLLAGDGRQLTDDVDAC